MLLSIKNLTFTYPSSGSPALKELSFDVNEGEFLSIVGRTGCGKTTLVRLLKPELAPKGKRMGSILFRGKELYEIEARDAAAKIGFVCQSPEHQVVTDRVWHELAFGLESLGVERSEIRRRVCEIADFFGISGWFDKDTSALSGGEQQLLALASVMVMKPEMLILDEPLSRLDPVSVKKFMSVLKRINEELGVTIILVEHNIEEALSACDRVLVMEEGQIKYLGAPQEMLNCDSNRPATDFLTAGMLLFNAFGGPGPGPVSVKEARTYLNNQIKAYGADRVRKQCDELRYGTVTGSSCSADLRQFDVQPEMLSNAQQKEQRGGHVIPALELRDVYYRYEGASDFAVRCLSMDVFQGEIFCILGGNGSGKSTLLSILTGQHKADEGKIRIFGKGLKEYKNNSLYSEILTWMPQNPELLLAEETVEKELKGDLSPKYGIDLSTFSKLHPYDLSGGEQQLLAFIKTAGKERRLYLLDEPTKGLDREHKRLLAKAVLELKAENKAVLVVTHDAEFASMCADRCTMMFRGEAVSIARPEEFFAQNLFYTTPLSRILDGLV